MVLECAAMMMILSTTDCGSNKDEKRPGKWKMEGGRPISHAHPADYCGADGRTDGFLSAGLTAPSRRLDRKRLRLEY